MFFIIFAIYIVILVGNSIAFGSIFEGPPTPTLVAVAPNPTPKPTSSPTPDPTPEPEPHTKPHTEFDNVRSRIFLANSIAKRESHNTRPHDWNPDGVEPCTFLTNSISKCSSRNAWPHDCHPDNLEPRIFIADPIAKQESRNARVTPYKQLPTNPER